jgi:hypothetical protein
MQRIYPPEPQKHEFSKPEPGAKLFLVIGENDKSAQDEKEIDKKIGIIDKSRAVQMAEDLIAEMEQRDKDSAETAPGIEHAVFMLLEFQQLFPAGISIGRFAGLLLFRLLLLD